MPRRYSISATIIDFEYRWIAGEIASKGPEYSGVVVYPYCLYCTPFAGVKGCEIIGYDQFLEVIFLEVIEVIYG